MGGEEESPTRLTWKYLNDGWGSCLNFSLSYGLKVWNPQDCDEALVISRALKAADRESLALSKSEKVRREKDRVRGSFGEFITPTYPATVPLILLEYIARTCCIFF